MSTLPLPLIQNHCDTRNLSDHVDFRRIVEYRGRALGSGMRQEDQPVLLETTPTEDVSAAMFQEINRPFEFVTPGGIDNLAPALIDQHQGARLQEGVHAPVL